VTDDETQAAPSDCPTDHAHAWSLDDTVPYLGASQRTTLWLRICAALAAASVAALIGVLIFVLHDRDSARPSNRVEPARNETAAAQTAAVPPAAAPTETVTKTIAAPPPPVEVAPASSQTTFVICDDGREGVVGGHTTCLFAENVRRAFYASNDGSEVVAYSPVTGERYEMVCSGGFRANFTDGSHRIATRCIGGDNDSAEVVIW
jgi:hypothetical protein